MKSRHEGIRRFTTDEAMRMVEVGILGEDEHVELLDGLLVETGLQEPEQAHAVVTLSDRIRAVYPGRVREEKPLTIGTYSLPEPDIAVVREAGGAYAHRHPTGVEAILVIEVAHTSQAADRRKASIYAEGGVRVYWLVDIKARRLKLHTTPVDGAYQVTHLLDPDDVVALPESTESWSVRDLLPSR